MAPISTGPTWTPTAIARPSRPRERRPRVQASTDCTMSSAQPRARVSSSGWASGVPKVAITLVADEFVERTAVGKMHSGHALVEDAQEVDGLLRRLSLHEAREAHDIDEQHGGLASAARLEIVAGAGEPVDQVGREVAREVVALALRHQGAPEMRSGPPHPRRR